ncbi:hypothetical protein [Bacillus sp. mrc49]|uniref:hypothetical protein n=2 Tax=Bacillus sp. mrc49 TaxID=2054913 RepID=UPI000C27374C|nr:hypothetical protein [Bacillus sp. mrc49]PJN87698.1 hypothetical protein CVN76_24400 [Bacillus sp. mrc49]PJN91375.1 hypothetical protein CVN76_05330 [Bacillus sp. mrc49]
MKGLAGLRKIVEGQKTVSTKRLKPLLDEIQSSYIQTGNKVKSQAETIRKINKKYSVVNSKAARLSVHVQTHEDLKKAHSELKAKHKAAMKELHHFRYNKNRI